MVLNSFQGGLVVTLFYDRLNSTVRFVGLEFASIEGQIDFVPNQVGDRVTKASNCCTFSDLYLKRSVPLKSTILSLYRFTSCR